MNSFYTQKITLYQHNVDKYQYHGDKLRKKLWFIAILRLIAFLVAISGFIIYINQPLNWLLFLSTGLLGIFVYLIKYHQLIQERKEQITELLDINRKEESGIKGDHSEFTDGSEFINKDHPYSFDLDLFGPKSVFQMINRSATSRGHHMLADTLLHPLENETTIQERQKAIAELAGNMAWRHHFLATGKRMKGKPEDENTINQWLSQPAYFAKKHLYQVSRWFLPVLMILSIGLLIHSSIWFPFFLIILIANLTLSHLENKKMNQAEFATESCLRAFKKYQKLFEQIENKEFHDKTLKSLQSELYSGSDSASKLVNILAKRLNLYEYKNNLLTNLILNGLFCWNLHTLIRIEKWKKKHKAFVPQWIDSLGMIDTLSSLGNMAFNYEEFCYPEVHHEYPVLQAEEMGHPLIMASQRVNNTITLAQNKTFIVITGPNMAGKSTFLRATGVNLILAKIGAPVCAKKFSFRLMPVFTSMRTSDSLSKNESYFLAELRRLKSITDALEKHGEGFVLLDEILKGTNIKDKQEGSKKIIRHMIQLHAAGIIATHDLSISELKNQYPDKLFDKSFEMEIDQDKFYFPYKLHEGKTLRMNALILMKEMGLGISE